MDPQPKSPSEPMPEWAKFPKPNTIPDGWDVSVFEEWQAAQPQENTYPVEDADPDR